MSRDHYRTHGLKTKEYSEDKTELLTFDYMRDNYDHIHDESEFMLVGFRLDRVDGHYELNLAEKFGNGEYMLKRAGIIKMPREKLVELKNMILDALST